MTGRGLVLGALLVAAFLGYSLGFSGPLIFDDFAALTANNLLHLDASVLDQWRVAAISSASGPTGRPVAMFSFALHTALAGEVVVFWIKLVNALIHCVTAWLFYLLAVRLLDRVPGLNARIEVRWLALLAAAIWLLHPLHVSTVLYAVQRMTQLATLFACAGLLVFVHYRQRWADHGAPPGEVLAAVLWLLLLTLAATLSKENGALLPVLVLTVEICFFRGEWAGRQVAMLRWGAVALTALFLLAVISTMVLPPDFIAARYGGREFTWQERALTQPRLLWHYLSWLALPDISAMGFQHDDIPLSKGIFQPVSTLIAIAAWVVTMALALLLCARYPLFSFAVLFYLVGHSLESTSWPLEMVYEHRNYLPSMGVCLLLASVLCYPLRGQAATRLPGYLIGGTVPLILFVLLVVRVDTWSDGLRLAGVNAHNHPESSRSSYFYGNALLKRFRAAREAGLTEEQAREALAGARYYFQKMYEQNPRDVAALVMLHSLDTVFFTHRDDLPDWLAKLEELLQSRVIQPSDRNALEALISCVNAGGCHAERERILALLALLEERYPDSLVVIGWRFNYLLGHEATAEELAEVIDRALAIDPGRREYLYRRIELQAKRNDVDGMYESVQAWLQYDHRRRSVHMLKALFATPQTGES